MCKTYRTQWRVRLNICTHVWLDINLKQGRHNIKSMYRYVSKDTHSFFGGRLKFLLLGKGCASTKGTSIALVFVRVQGEHCIGLVQFMHGNSDTNSWHGLPDVHDLWKLLAVAWRRRRILFALLKRQAEVKKGITVRKKYFVRIITQLFRIRNHSNDNGNTYGRESCLKILGFLEYKDTINIISIYVKTYWRSTEDVPETNGLVRRRWNHRRAIGGLGQMEDSCRVPCQLLHLQHAVYGIK